VPVRRRLRVLSTVRRLLAERAEAMAATVVLEGRQRAETLAAEVLPLCDALKWCVSNAERLLRPQRIRRGRPLWLWGTRLTLHRDPHGVVLIIAPGNYPLFLAAVQAIQALAAGNAVILKPAPGHTAPLAAFAALCHEAGLPQAALQLLGTDPSEAEAAIDAGPNLVVFTGSSENGAEVRARCASAGVPAILELSGCDAVFVLPGADLQLVERAVAFGRRFNAGRTCIAPQRVFVTAPDAAELQQRLKRVAPELTPVVVEDANEALDRDRRNPYALGATVFGPTAAAEAFAARVNAGVVVINDMIVPTADPRLPFGGRDASGYGTTRGADGLLAMTRVKAISTRAGGSRAHLAAPHHEDQRLIAGWIHAAHSQPRRSRWHGWRELLGAGWRRWKETR
jgi:aldehyde dehydrogenase (NAD+)